MIQRITMRLIYILQTLAVLIFSVQTIIVASVVPDTNLEIDPDNYAAKEVPPNISRGGIQKLHDRDVHRFENKIESISDKKSKSRKLRTGHLRSDSGGGSAPVYYDDYYDDFVYYDDDQVVTETILVNEFYQDNRFSNPEPVLSDPSNPTREASGNRWLYANVPLQPIFGINDLPIQGLAQGFCTGVNSDQDGFCHFTYEFFDLQGGAIVVFASLTVEGSTKPQGPSTLVVLGGTGDYQGAVGEVTLWPVNIDEKVLPARIFRDGSLFLGNRNGYEAKFEISVRELVNKPQLFPVPMTQPVTAPVTTPESSLGDEASVVTASSFAQRVTCPGQAESEYCDCDLDCQTTSARCSCQEARECCDTQ